MTKNLIPIENKKPVETVYELKAEYPSFEEFQKTYQADEAVISSYENELLANGEVVGYGPCKVCNKSTQWTLLYIKCPAVGCPSRDRDDDSRSYWIHRYCGGYAKISNKARLSCSDCGRDRHMSKWNFRCSEHNGETVESVDYDSFNKCLGLAMRNRDCGQVVKDLAIYITNHEEEWE